MRATRIMDWMRRALAAAAALSCAACGLGGQGFVDGQRLLPAQPGVDQAQAERLIEGGAPRLQIVLVEREIATLMVKAGERDGIARWRTIDNTQIFTRDGFIIGTRGLSFDMMSADPGAAPAAIRAGRAAQVSRLYTYLDGEERTIFRAYVCDISPVGPERVEIPDAPALPSLLVREECFSPAGGFTNMYWIHEGRVVRTLQFIGDRVGRALILFLP